MDLNGLEQFALDNYELRKTAWLPIQNTSYLENHENAVSEGINDKVDQILNWLKRYDSELSRNTRGRLNIGFKKKEIHNQVQSKFDSEYVKCILNITTARSKLMNNDARMEEVEIELPPKTPRSYKNIT